MTLNANGEEDRYFVEDLITANPLQTTYYVTHHKQVADFFWYRKSGLRLNLGLEDISLVSSYQENCGKGEWWQQRNEKAKQNHKKGEDDEEDNEDSQKDITSVCR